MRYILTVMASALAILSACSSSPEPQYYTLSSVAGASHEGKVLTIKIRHPIIPPTLDRPEMVSQRGSFRIQENDNHLWSEPLDTMIERILSEDLRKRLPQSMIVTESSEVSVKDAYVVDIDVQQFGTDAQGNAALQAQVIIRQPDGKAISRPITFHGAPITSAESMAQTLSILLGELSDSLANILSIR